MRVRRIALRSMLRVVALVCGLAAFHSRPVVAQIRNVQEMSTDQIAALDRARAVVLIPGGILEEHGPYCHRIQTGIRANTWRATSQMQLPRGRDGAY